MICLKDKSTIAISCHMFFSRRISLDHDSVFLSEQCKAFSKEAATAVHRVSGLKA